MTSPAAFVAFVFPIRLEFISWSTALLLFAAWAGSSSCLECGRSTASAPSGNGWPSAFVWPSCCYS